MKKVKIFVFILFMFLFTNVNALEVKTGAIYRKNANNATILFSSDTNGTYYYKITNSSDVPNDIKTNGTLGGSVVADNIVNANITTLTTGKKYVHILVTDGSNEKIFTVELPYDLYYVEDFEIYDEESYPEFFYIKYNGKGNTYQKIINTTQLNNTNGKVFSLNGRNSWASDQRIEIDEIFSNGIIVLESDIKLNSTFPASLAIGNLNASYWTGNLAAIFFEDTKFKYGIGDSSNNETSSIKRYSSGDWLRAKIVLDSANHKYDYYINGEKINSEHIDTLSGYLVKFFAISSCNDSITYFDNIKLYNNTISSLVDHTITLENDSNGTISTNKLVANSDDNIIITVNPSTGYQLKDIKILKSSNNDDVTNLVSYDSTSKSFIMPDYDVDVEASFEKIPYVISVSSVDNVTVNPSGNINVLYGENKDIEIKANIGYKLKSVKVNGVEQTLPLSDDKIKLTNIQEDYTIVVEVEQLSYVINVSPVENTSINPSGMINVVYGENKDIEIKANIGYKLKSVKVNGVEQTLPLSDDKIKLTNIQEDYTIVVEVEIEENETNTDINIINPKTFDNIIINFILLLISLMSLIIIIINKNKIHN